MFDIGFMELMVVAILGLLVLGPERLPKAARTVGLLVGRIRRTMNNLQDDLERQVRTEELRKKLQDPYATFLDEDNEGNKVLPPKPATAAAAAPEPVSPATEAAAVAELAGPAQPLSATTESPATNQDQKPS